MTGRFRGSAGWRARPPGAEERVLTDWAVRVGRKSDSHEEPGHFHFDEDVGVVEVIAVFTGLLFPGTASQKGGDQFPEFRRVVPALPTGHPESQPVSVAEDVGRFRG
jgi:hypothetical protein